jgi:phosphoribosylformylglycinamidine synthase
MKFGVVIFPGSNCDQDVLQVLETISPKPVAPLWHQDHDLQGCDFMVLPGGFSYGDYLRSGAIARFSPIMQEVVVHAQKVAMESRKTKKPPAGGFFVLRAGALKIIPDR